MGGAREGSCDPRLPGSHRTASTPRTRQDLRMRASRPPPPQPPPPTTPTSRRWASTLMTGEGLTLFTLPGPWRSNQPSPPPPPPLQASQGLSERRGGQTSSIPL